MTYPNTKFDQNIRCAITDITSKKDIKNKSVKEMKSHDMFPISLHKCDLTTCILVLQDDTKY